MTSFRLLLLAMLPLLNLAPVAAASDHLDHGATRAQAPARSGVLVPQCWQSRDPICVPDFENYFPDDPTGALALAGFWSAPDRRESSASPTNANAAAALVRQGLRRYAGDRTAVLRWFGRTYITGASPQHPAAIELMFHASGTPEMDVRRPAVFFGLSTVEPKPPAVLCALIDIAMATDDPNLLSRIAWGVGEQREETAPWLAAHRESRAPETREKARVVAAILARELKAFDWAMERKRRELRRQHGYEMPGIARDLSTGSSEQHLRLLEYIATEELLVIMDESFLQAFRDCARDADPEVRRTVARMVGQRWIGAAPEPLPRAVDLLLDLSRDADRETRYNAVYYGLSTIRVKEKAVIRRLVEIAFDARDPELYQRIAWGLRGQRSEARAMLDRYVAGEVPGWADAAREVYADLGGLPAG